MEPKDVGQSIERANERLILSKNWIKNKQLISYEIELTKKRVGYWRFNPESPERWIMETKRRWFHDDIVWIIQLLNTCIALRVPLYH